MRSALEQSYPRIEVVVCDDGSTDRSLALLEELRVGAPALKVVHQENLGQSAALSAAFAASSGDVVCLLDADDYMHPQRARKVVEALKSDPAAGMAIHRTFRVDANKAHQGVYPAGSDLPGGWLGPRVLAAGGFVQWIFMAMISLRREVAERIFPLDPEAGRFADVILRGAAAMLAPVAAIEEPLTYYRFHGANVGNTALRYGIEETVERRRRDLRELEAAYGSLDRWLQRVQGAHLPPFESTRPYLERRYVIARLAGEPRADQDALRRKLLALPDAMSPALRSFYRAGPLLPRPLFKSGLELVYGQGRVKSFLASARRRLARRRS